MRVGFVVYQTEYYLNSATAVTTTDINIHFQLIKSKSKKEATNSMKFSDKEINKEIVN